MLFAVIAMSLGLSVTSLAYEATIFEEVEGVFGKASMATATTLEGPLRGYGWMSGYLRWGERDEAALLVVGEWMPDRVSDGYIWALVPAKGYIRFGDDSWALVLGSFALRSLDGFLWSSQSSHSWDIAGETYKKVWFDNTRLILSRGAHGIAMRFGNGRHAMARIWSGVRAIPKATVTSSAIPLWSSEVGAFLISAGADAEFRLGDLWQMRTGGVLTKPVGDITSISYAEKRLIDDGTKALVAAAVDGRIETCDVRGVALVQFDRSGTAFGLFADADYQATPKLKTGPVVFYYDDDLKTVWGTFEEPTSSVFERVGGRNGVAWQVSVTPDRRFLVEATAGVVSDKNGLRVTGRAITRARLENGWWVDSEASLAGRINSDPVEEALSMAVKSSASAEVGKKWKGKGNLALLGNWMMWPSGLNSGRAQITAGVKVLPELNIALNTEAFFGPLPGVLAGTAARFDAAIRAKASHGFEIQAKWHGRLTADLVLYQSAMIALSWSSKSNDSEDEEELQ